LEARRSSGGLLYLQQGPAATVLTKVENIMQYGNNMAPAFTLVGSFRQLTGSDTGYITISLAGFRPQIPRTSDGVLADVFSSTAPAASSFSVTLYGNDSITPGSTYYNISLFDANGKPVIQNVPYYFSGSGTFDLATLTPLTAAPPSIPVPPVTVPAGEFLGGPIGSSGSGAPTYRLIDGQDLTARSTGGEWYVGGTNAQFGPLSDFGAQVNYVYNNLMPFSGGTIRHVPNADGTATQFSTPIVFGTDGKYVRLVGVGSSQTGNVNVGTQGGSTLYFTPTTSSVNFSITSVANADGTTGQAVYTGTITGTPSNYVGKTFAVSGFKTTTAAGNFLNNGNFVCVAASPTTLTLCNMFATAETPASAARASQIVWAITYNNDGSDVFAGDGFCPGNVISDITLTNALQSMNTCANYGLSTQSAAGGIDYSHAGRLSTQNVRINGFGVGRQIVNPVGWGTTNFNHVLSRCAVGELIHNGSEGAPKYFGGAILTNGVGVQISGTNIAVADCLFDSVSIDSNGSVNGWPISGGFTGGFGGGVITHLQGGWVGTFVSPHFENLISGDPSGAAPSHYINSNSGPFTIVGGIASNDSGTGTTDYWFQSGGNAPYLGGFMNVVGLSLVNGGQHNTTIFSVNGTGAFLSGNSAIPSGQVGSLFSGSGFANVTCLMSPTNPFTFASGLSTSGVIASGTITSDKYQVVGVAPTIAASPTVPTAVFGGTDSAMIIQLSPTGSPPASGAFTVNFSSPFVTANGVVATATLFSNSGSGTWNARGTVQLTHQTLSSASFAWDNNGVGLTASSAYFITINVVGF
jgi:hypothetical protein